MGKKRKFSEYLLEKFTDWIKAQKEPKTVTEFANEAGISRQTILKLMEKDSDLTPRPKTVDALAKVIGDDIYTFLGIEKPETELELVNQVWKELKEEEKKQILQIVEPYSKP